MPSAMCECQGHGAADVTDVADLGPVRRDGVEPAGTRLGCRRDGWWISLGMKSSDEMEGHSHISCPPARSLLLGRFEVLFAKFSFARWMGL